MLQPQIIESQKQRYYRQGYWTEKTLLDYWKDAVSQYGDREYLTDSRGFRLTYGEIEAQASRLAFYFREAGVEEGDIVACQIPVWYEFAVAVVACFKVGAVIHPLSVAYEEADLLYFLKLHRPVVFLCPTVFRGRDYEAQITRLLPDLPFLKRVVLLDQKARKKGIFPTLAEILETTPQLRGFRPTRTTADHVAALLCTSGSTGVSKGAMLTHNNIAYAELAFHRELALTGADVMFMPSPLNHATGFQHGIIAAMLHGSRVVLQEKFQVEEAIFLMNQEGCTYSMGATTFIYDILRVLKKTNGTLRKMRFYLCGGAPVPPQMVQAAWDRGVRLCEVYGSTESTPHVFVPPAEALEKNGSVSGRPIEGVEIRVADENGNAVPDGVEGEEWSRGPNVFVGYTGNGADGSLDGDGWFHSGDLCVRDKAGYIRITGRKKDLIIRGGENLNANLLDANLDLCPEIREHAVVGMPDPRMGERICAYAVLQPDVPSFSLMDLLTRFYAEKVPKWQWPERLEIVPSLPKTDSGKIKKYVLQNDIREKIQKENTIRQEGAGCAN